MKMTGRISEKNFKNNLINHLKTFECGWEDGDKKPGKANKKTADVINCSLQVAIEIKDDGNFSDSLGRNFSKALEIRGMNRQLRELLRDSSKKFNNYPNYRSLVLFRTDKADWPWAFLESAIYGVQDSQEKHGYKFPSSIFTDNNGSIKHIGGILFYGRKHSFFIKNINPNISKGRRISYEWIKVYFPGTKEIIPNKIPREYQ